ncbi:hypothetical protein [Cellulomonas composti]|uniref:Uncharacterized protein n=1 Tax=Cellulomonas composti TaxID=266130 RepID=A0A511J743_9CELL|nr:hypothetical protein [Cellulomonas composti]GEL93832.1 hypothetical protein CCO02nite_04900 [Cellulomonas composti]
MTSLVLGTLLLVLLLALSAALVRTVRRDGMAPRGTVRDWAVGTTLPIARSTRAGR